MQKTTFFNAMNAVLDFCINKLKTNKATKLGV